MAGYIEQNLLDEILSRVDIAELIASYFPLKRAGRNFKACCPFHNEKTPSFMVNPERQIFHCFGCGKGGNAFTFLMEHERMGFMEVVELLAHKSGVVLPKQSSHPEKDSSISNIYKINSLASSFYQGFLYSPEGATAREYFKKRQMHPDVCKFFGLGLSSDKWDSLLTHLRNKKISLALIEKAGLICSRREGGYYDRFRKRIIFPIFDIKNRVVAFGARLLNDEPDQAKYVNSPETLVYVKGRHLYGLNFTREAVRKNDCVIVVEGYLDCITTYQSGIKNVVASLGTSLTLEQIRLLKRYTRNIVMFYDSDSAGQSATLRSLDILIKEEMDVRVAELPQGFDPDSFLCKFGPDAFRERIVQAKGIFDYKLGYLNSVHDRTKPEDKSRIAKEMLASISNFKSAVLQSEYIRRLSHALDINEEALFVELKKARSGASYEGVSLIKPKAIKSNPTEKLLMNLLLRETELIKRIRSELNPDDFQDTRIARVFSLVCDLVSEGKPIQPNRLMGHFDDQESVSLISELLANDDLPQEEAEEVFNDCIGRIKKQRIDTKCQLLQKRIKTAQAQDDQELLNNLIAEFRDLQQSRFE